MTDTHKVALGFVIFILLTYTMLIVGLNYETSLKLKCIENVTKINSNISEVKDLCGVR